MASYITSVSVDNAWGGKVSQQLEFLSVDDARKALLISTLHSKHQVDMNVPHVPFSAKMFDFEPENLVTVLYGANGSGKTTTMQMLNGFSELIEPIMKEHIARRRRSASTHDMRHWSKGTIPPSFRHPDNSKHIKMLDFRDNPVIRSIRQSMRRSEPMRAYAIEDSEASIDWRSNFSFEVKGVCETPYLWWSKIDEGDLPSADSAYEISLRPFSGFGCEWNGIVRNDEKIIENFEGAFFTLRFEVKSFPDDFHTDLGEQHQGPFMDILRRGGEGKVQSMKFELPLMIHPDGGVLVLGRTLMDLSKSAPSESRFKGIDFWDEGDDVHKDICLLSLMKHRDDEELHEYFTDINADSPRPEEDACAFSRHMIYEIWTDGMPSDFFLSPKEIPPHKRGGPIGLPSLLDEAHFRHWDKLAEENGVQELSFENAVDGCTAGDFLDLIASLKTEYIFPSKNEPDPIVAPKTKSGRFSSLFVAEKPAAYIQAMCLLDPPLNAWDGFLKVMAPMLSVGQDTETMYNAMVKINHVNKNKSSRNSQVSGPTIGSGDYRNSDILSGNTFPPYDELKQTLSAHYAAKGCSKVESDTKAEVEIKHLIQNELEQVWFNDLERHAIVSRFNRMNQFLNEHLNIRVLDSSSKFSVKSLYFNRDTSKPVRFHTKANIKYEELSSGMRNFLNLIMALGKSKPTGPLLVDEPEISLHVDWQYALKDIATELADYTKRQVIFSTHSPDLIMNFGDRSIPFVSEAEHDGA